MSNSVLSNVRNHAPVKGSEFAVLMVMADIADEHGLCWPSMQYIARAARISDRQARRIVRGMADKGYITITTRRGRTHTNFYRIRTFTPDEYTIRVDGDEEHKDAALAEIVARAEESKNRPSTSGFLADTEPVKNRTPATAKSDTGDRKIGHSYVRQHHKTPQDPSGYIQPEPKSAPKRSPDLPPTRSGFADWYQVYPRKVAKGAAEAAWNKLAPNETLSQQIIAATIAQRDTVFKNVEPRYIPHPATWLNRRQWEDDIPEPSAVDTRGSQAGEKDWYADFLADDPVSHDRSGHDEWSSHDEAIDADFREKRP